MAFSDMVAAAAEAERQRRQKARDALAKAAVKTESPWSELAETATQDKSQPATIVAKATTLVSTSRAKVELSQAINSIKEAQRKGQSTQITEETTV